MFILLVITLAGSACFAVAMPVSAADNGINFHLKLIEEEQPTLEVTLEFNVEKDQKIALSPEGDYTSLIEGSTLYLDAISYPSPVFTIVSVSEDTVKLEPLPDSGSGWLVTGIKNGTAQIVYSSRKIESPDISTEQYVNANTAVMFSASPPVYEPSVFPIVKHDIKVIKASELLICPKIYPDMSSLGESYTVSVEKRNDEKLFVPWDLNDEGTGFNVNGTSELLDNFITWGIIDEVTIREDNPEIVAGFSTDYQRLTDSEKKEYAQNMGLIYEDLSNNLVSNRGVNRVPVVLCGARRFSFNSPDWDTLRSSSVIFHGGKGLKGEPSVTAAGAFFDLWNGYAFVPSLNGDSLWFEKGMSIFYPLRIANSSGLLDKESAFEMLSEIYVDYLDNPIGNETLGNLEQNELFNSDGFASATLCASIDKRIIDETGGEKDISWLAGQVSNDFEHSEGKEYGLNDIIEILDEGAGGGWQKFLSERVIEKHLFLASEFSESGLFRGKSSAKPGGSNSTRNWILLGVAIIVILSMPVIFSSYVRRAVKLDIKMPKIIPDDDFDDDVPEGEGRDKEDES
ncbi:MAG: hypothetical protein JXA49_09700 [Actinobacteria bacterium]|nr:hypothetical protein [Actinomycetota bacterium]